ncbi:MAG: GxxExxY protein [Chloroflexi bacterium]|nr:GxxExxY protein [Chloroflexota bacterium]
MLAQNNFREPDKELDLLASRVIDAAFQVHRTLGPGFLESVYEEALCIELKARGNSFVRQKEFAVTYGIQKIGTGRIDLLVEEKLIVELKAVDALVPIHTAQVISYLKASGLHLGLLINFNVPLLKEGIKRIVFTK